MGFKWACCARWSRYIWTEGIHPRNRQELWKKNFRHSLEIYVGLIQIFQSRLSSTMEKPTKRSILSRIALIFDPLGLLGSVTLLAKVIMQNLWRLRMDWDESIPLDLFTRWQCYENELQDLRDISIPRHVISLNQPIYLEMHGFSNASEIAFGAFICEPRPLMENTRRTYFVLNQG